MRRANNMRQPGKIGNRGRKLHIRHDLHRAGL